jgi:hypothetical protein
MHRYIMFCAYCLSLFIYWKIRKFFQCAVCKIVQCLTNTALHFHISAFTYSCVLGICDVCNVLVWYGNRPGRGKVTTSWYDICWLACRECVCTLWSRSTGIWSHDTGLVLTWYFEGVLGKAKPMGVSYPLESYLSMTPLCRCQIWSVYHLHRNT